MSSEKIYILDTTLRDGEQAPGAAMSVDEKCAIAKMLDDSCVDVIEAGFAISSQGAFDAIKKISQFSSNSTISSLARAKEADILSAAEALQPAKHKRIHTFISTSPVHIKYKLKMTEEQVLDAIKYSVELALHHCDEVEWSAEDATRTQPEFLFKCIDIAIKSGAKFINIPDTVGYIIPNEYFELIKSIKNNVANIDKAIISTHCHNDLGLAVANSLSAIQAGARQIECTINGIGERAGNAALEEIVMALKVRKDLFNNLSCGFKTQNIMQCSRLVSSITGFAVQKNKAIVGANAFVHESGIHQDGILKNRQTYEIINPQDIGLTKTELALGKTSGRNAFKNKLEELGYKNLSDDKIEESFIKFKNLCDIKKSITDEDIMSIARDVCNEENNLIAINSFTVMSFSGGKCKADVSITIEGVEQKYSIEGDGPIDCIFKSINNAYKNNDDSISLDDYSVQSIGEKTDAIARASVRLKTSIKIDGVEKNITITANADDTDTISASAKAYIKAMKKIQLAK